MQRAFARGAVARIAKAACSVRVAMLRGRVRGFAWVKFGWISLFAAAGSLRMCAAIDAPNSRLGATTMSRSGAVSLKLRGYFVLDELFDLVEFAAFDIIFNQKLEVWRKRRSGTPSAHRRVWDFRNFGKLFFVEPRSIQHFLEFFFIHFALPILYLSEL